MCAKTKASAKPSGFAMIARVCPRRARRSVQWSWKKTGRWLRDRLKELPHKKGFGKIEGVSAGTNMHRATRLIATENDSYVSIFDRKLTKAVPHKNRMKVLNWTDFSLTIWEVVSIRGELLLEWKPSRKKKTN